MWAIVILLLQHTFCWSVLNWAPFMALTPSLRCLRLSSCDGLNWGSRSWGVLVRVGSLLSGACLRVRACRTSEFYVVFTSGFVSSSSTQWYGQNIILTTFIFEQKSNTTSNHKLWYQLLGILLPLRNGGVHDHCSKEAKHTSTQYITWFGKLHTSTGEIDIIRDRERIQHTEEDHIHSTPISHCYIGQQLHKAAGLLVAALLFSFSLLLSFVALQQDSLSHFVLHSWCLFIGFNDCSSYFFVNNGGWQTYQTLTLDNSCWLPLTTHHYSLLLWQCQGATNAIPAAPFDSHMTIIFFDNGSHLLWQWQHNWQYSNTEELAQEGCKENEWRETGSTPNEELGGNPDASSVHSPSLTPSRPKKFGTEDPDFTDVEADKMATVDLDANHQRRPTDSSFQFGYRDLPS